MGAVMAMLAPDASADEIAAHQRAVERMLSGIRKYQSHDFRRAMPPLDEIWRAGGARIDYHQAAPNADRHARPLLVIPSMINGSEILDLHPARSFVRWMAGQGFDVYLLDWGVPSQDDGLVDINGVLARLNDAARFVRRHAGADAVDAVGYCMGGTLLLGAAAGAPDLYERIVLLSAPWDFHAGDPRMRAQVMTGAASALQLLEHKSVLPVDWIQGVFAHVNPRLALDKFASFLDMESGSEGEEIFISVEDWLNSGQDLSAGIARCSIIDWYGHNKPGRGDWGDMHTLAGHPMLVVAAERDILVPPDSAVAAAQHSSRATVLKPPCGHISLMAGRRAVDDVWMPTCAWLKASA